MKFDGRRKCRLVAGVHQTDAPKEDIFSGVVSMEAVRLGFILARLNGLMVCAGDVGNAFLYGKTREKVYVIAGEEFGVHKGKRMSIDRSLYGLRSSAARFHEHQSEKLRKLGFRPSKADPDQWFWKHENHDEFIARFVVISRIETTNYGYQFFLDEDRKTNINNNFNYLPWNSIGGKILKLYQNKRKYIDDNKNLRDKLLPSQKKSLDRWLDIDDDNDERIKNIKMELRLSLFNNRNVPLSTRKKNKKLN